MEERKKIKKFEKIYLAINLFGLLCLTVSAISLSFGAFILGGIFIGIMLSSFIVMIIIGAKIQEYSLLKQIFHYKGPFPQLENYGFVLKNTVYTRTTPRGDNTYTVYINFDSQIYCEKNGKEVPEFNFVISDLIRDGLVTVEREVI